MNLFSQFLKARKTPTMHIFKAKESVEDKIQRLRDEKDKIETRLRKFTAEQQFRRNVAESFVNLMKAIFEFK